MNVLGTEFEKDGETPVSRINKVNFMHSFWIKLLISQSLGTGENSLVKTPLVLVRCLP